MENGPLSDTVRSIRVLLNQLFRDGQPPGAITPQHLRDLIMTMEARSYLSIKEFGAVGDGVTDDTTAFKAARDFVKTQYRRNPAPDSTNESLRLTGVRIVIPRGDYLITEPYAMMDDDPAVGRNIGVAWEGEAAGGVQILYQPKRSGPLLYNRDSYLGLTFRNLVFTAGDSGSDFMYSVSHGGAQNYLFHQVQWSGSWRYGLYLKGNDNNDSFDFYKCRFCGSWLAFLCAEDSDQFLMYRFTSCSYWTSYQWVRMAMGGHVKVDNCDISGYRPAEPIYLFELLGAHHASGVCSFVCTKSRFELQNRNAKVLRCEWAYGNFAFYACDFSSQTPFVSGNFNTVLVDFAGSAGPQIKWDNCQIAGRHEYRYGADAWHFEPKILYENCNLIQAASAADFIVFTEVAGNPGGRPVIRFRNCAAGNSAQGGIIDTDLSWHISHAGETTRKLINLRTPDGLFPGNGAAVTIRLPLNAVIIQIRWFAAPDHVSRKAPFDFILQYAGLLPVALARIQGSDQSRGFDATQDMFFCCDTAARQVLTLRDGSGHALPSRTAYCLVEYIG